MPRETRPSWLVLASVTLSVFGGVIVVFGQRPPDETVQPFPLRESELIAQGKALPDYDTRVTSASVVEAQRQSAVELQQQIGPDTLVQFDARSGGVSQIFRAGSYLTDPMGGTPSTILNTFLSQHADVFGLSQAEMSSFAAVEEDLDAAGVTHLYLQQRFNGLRVFGSVLKGHVDSTARLISVEGNYYPSSRAVPASSTLSAGDAVIAALRSSVPDTLTNVLTQQAPAALPPGSSLVTVGSPYRFPQLSIAERGPDRWTTFEPGPFARPIEVRQVIFPTAEGPVLAWEVDVDAPDRQAYYVLLVDAATGTLLYRKNTSRFDADPYALVFPKSPDASPATLLRFSGDPVASPLGWSDGPATLGNNVQADSATSTSDFVFPFTDAWSTVGVNPFDLANVRLRFVPTDALVSGYTVSAFESPAGSTDPAATDLGPIVSNQNDGTVNLTCSGFSAAVLGATFTSLWVNTNGSVSFGSGSTDPSPSKITFSNGPRRIAALWRNLDVGAGGTLTGDCEPEGEGARVRIAWNAVRNFGGGAATHTFAIVVHGGGTGLDNVIDLDYGTVDSPSGELVGVGGNTGTPFNPTTTGIVNYRDLSEGSNPGIAGGLAQTFPDPDLNLSITNFAYHLNRMHDYFYRKGFTEAAGNFQVSNLTRGGAPLDPVQAEAQTGLGIFNNATFSSPPDGTPGVARFGLFSIGTCRRDSGLDATVIYHEFTHGVSTRMVGGPQNVATLGSFQGGALGEGWSDAFPMSIFNDPVAGAYVTCNPRGIRSAPYNIHPATYADFGNKLGPFAVGIGTVFRPEVHRDGEIWAATVWDLHVALGPQVTQQLLFDGFRYTPVEPSMVDAKNAVLIADQVDYGGVHLNELYRIFARRGLGVSASTSPGSFSTAPLQNGWMSTVFAAFDTPATRYAPEPPSVVFSDNFDEADVWTTEGTDGAGGGPLWHLSQRQSSSGVNAFYYGNEGTGTYDTGFRNFGTLTSPDIQLPFIGATQTIALEWDQFRQTADPFFFDGGFVRIIDVRAGTTTQVSFVQNTRSSSGTLAFAHQKVNLQPFAGRLIKVQFYMDTLDPLLNNGQGWYVDSVVVSVVGPRRPSR